jgi:hypothetical protein
LIHRNWNSKQGFVIENMVMFDPERRHARNIAIEEASGNGIVDLASKRALLLTEAPPLRRHSQSDSHGSPQVPIRPMSAKPLSSLRSRWRR